MNSEKISSKESLAAAPPTGWESVAEMADKANLATETAKDKEIDPKVISKIDDYMMSNPEHPLEMAEYVADLAGVAAGIKPTALVRIMPTDVNIDHVELAGLIRQSGLYVADGWEHGFYFVSKNINLANQVKEKFKRLWDGIITDEEDRDLGRLLGYPETAIMQDFGDPKTALDKVHNIFSKKRDPSLNRYYTHSPEHQEEEFEVYERPLHDYMEKHCPRATALLKEARSPRGRKFRW